MVGACMGQVEAEYCSSLFSLCIHAVSAALLKPGGRFAVSDVVVQGKLHALAAQEHGAWAGCVAGALGETTYRQLLFEVGRGMPVWRSRASTMLKTWRPSECCGDSLVTQSGFSELTASGGRLVSAFVRASKRTDAACQGPPPPGPWPCRPTRAARPPSSQRAARHPTRRRAARPKPGQHPPDAAAARRCHGRFRSTAPPRAGLPL